MRIRFAWYDLIPVLSYLTNKPGKLTDEEFEEMKKHPIHGKVLMRRLRPMIEAALGDTVDMSVVEQIVGCHHLRPDGKGYGIDPETDVTPKKISEIHEVLSRSQSFDGKVKITASGKVFREQEGKDIPVFGGKSRFRFLTSYVSRLTFTSTLTFT